MGSERRSLLDVMKKLPGRRWKGLRVFASHTNLPGGRWRQFPFGQTIGCAFEKEFRQNADPQTALYRRMYGACFSASTGKVSSSGAWSSGKIAKIRSSSKRVHSK